MFWQLIANNLVLDLVFDDTEREIESVLFLFGSMYAAGG